MKMTMELKQNPEKELEKFATSIQDAQEKAKKNKTQEDKGKKDES